MRDLNDLYYFVQVVDHHGFAPAARALGMQKSKLSRRIAALEEAAWLDGCGIWSAFWHVTLPLTRPGLVATAVLCFILSWSDFFFALILTRTQAVTAPVAIVNFLQYDGWEWGKIAAAGCLVMLPVLLFTVLVRKYLVHGLTAGGVKD